VKGWEKISQANVQKKKKTEEAIFMSDKADFNPNLV
jgi:hypothetical protein